MTTSGTYNFAPVIGDLFLSAFARIGIRRTAVVQEYIADARNEANFLQAEWVNKGVSLWTVDLVTIPLVQGTATYAVPPDTIMVLDLYVNNGSQNRLILPFSRTDYASLANPTQQGFPTSFWYDRTINPTVTFWPVPDGSTYTVSYYRYRQIQDAKSANGTQPEIPYIFLDAFVAGLAHRLARIYKPELEAARKADAVEAWQTANTQDVENVGMYVTPVMDSYYRG